MARVIDDTKLLAIKEALMHIIIRDGYNQASISKIAKQAKVSVGYLYRHYDSKESLVLSMYVEQFEKLNQILIEKIETYSSFEEVILGFYEEIVKALKNREHEIVFLLKTMIDSSIAISDEMREDLQRTISFIQEKFKEEINPKMEGEQIYIQVLGNILLFVNLRKRGVFKQENITFEDIKLLTQTTINALK